MSHRKLQTIAGHTDSNEHVSFCDWMAVSNMTKFRHPGLVTDAAAILLQQKVFFDALCPESMPVTITKAKRCWAVWLVRL